MQAAFIISDKTGKPYAVIGLLQGGTEFYPMSEAAKNWAGWMKDEFAGKKITKEQLVATLDNSMQIEGPIANVRANKTRLEELIKKSKTPADVSPIEAEKQTEEKSLAVSDELVEVLHLMDIHIGDMGNDEYRNVVNFKAASFIADSNRHTFAYEVKRTRATWDPSLRIPGTDRSGGWRCPVGTRYGGQITDRFGRNCGWGVARRLANEISDLGERMEGGLDKRRERRVNRRNERMLRRLQGGPGALERAAGRVAGALESGDGEVIERPKRPKRQRRGRGVIERAARRVAEALETDNNGGRGQDRPAPQRPRAPRAPQAQPRPRPQGRAPRQPRPDAGMPLPQGRRPRGNDIVEQRQRSIEAQRRMFDAEKARLRNERPDGISDKDWRDYQKFLDNHEPRLGYGGNDDFSIPSFEQWNRTRIRPEDVNPAARPANRAPRPQQPEAPSMRNTRPPAGAPRAGETLEQYKRRKYNEHQRNVREIREGGGNAGFLRYEEWEQFHGPIVEENWRRAQPSGGRSARNTASEARVKPAATRRPTAADAPEPKQPPRRERRPFNAPGQRGLADEGAALRKRNQMERDNADKDYKIVKHNNRYYVVEKEEVDRANARGANLEVRDEPPRPRRRPPAPPAAAPAAPSPAQNPPSRSTPRSVVPLNRLRDRHETKDLPRLAATDAKFAEVPVGNNGIRTKADALAYTGPISDIPDKFLRDALLSRSVVADRGDAATMSALAEKIYGRPPTNTELNDVTSMMGRVRQARTMGAAVLSSEDKEMLKKLRENGITYIGHHAGTGGANPTFHLLISPDGSIDGRGYLLKPPDRALGKGAQHAEIVGALLAERMGFAHGSGRIMPGSNPNKPYVLLELGPNFADGIAANVGNMTRGANDITDKESRFGMALLNGIMGATDRHDGNGMVFRNNGALPIDFGRAFASAPSSAQGMRDYVVSGQYRGIDRDPLSGYKKSLNDKIRAGKTRAEAKAEVRQEMKETLSRWASGMRSAVDDGSIDAIDGRFGNGSGYPNWGVAPIEQRKAIISRNIGIIESDEFIDKIMGDVA